MFSKNKRSGKSPSSSAAATAGTSAASLNKVSSVESGAATRGSWQPGEIEMHHTKLSSDGGNPEDKTKSAPASSTVGAGGEVGAAGPSAPGAQSGQSPTQSDQQREPVKKPVGVVTFVTVVVLIVVAALALIAGFYSVLSALFGVNFVDQVSSEFYKANIDGSVKPCDDFYQFACKKLAQSFEAKNVSKLHTRGDMLNRNLALLEQLLSQPVNSSHPTPLDQLRIFYQSCTDEDKIAAEGTAPLLQLLRDVGGWTLLDRENNSSESWIDVVRRANEAGFVTTFPFYLEIFEDSENTTKFSMRLWPLLDGAGSLPDFDLRVKYMRKVAQLLNATNPALENDVKECVRFENAFHKASNFSQTVREKTYAAQVLLEESSSIAWSQYFPAVFASSQVTITGSDSVTLVDPGFDSRIADLLEKTPVEVVRNYLVWRLIDGAIDFLPKEFRVVKLRSEQQTFEIDDFEQQTFREAPRGRFCLQTLRDNAGVVVGFVYAHHVFDARIKREVEVILRGIKDQAKEYLNEVTWIGNETIKKIVIVKLDQLDVIIAYVNGSLEAGFAKELVDNLRFRPNDSAFGNYRQVAGFHRNFRYGLLRITVAKFGLILPFVNGIEAEAMYSLSIHAGYVMAGLMQRPFFHLDQPPSLSYGTIGFAMAHEITHALQILSVCPNSDCSSFHNFTLRSNCTEKLYSGYTMKQVDQQVDGILTLEENVGDAIGLEIAYRAHEKWLRENDAPERILPDFEYSPRQWFWISAATGFCSYANDEELEKEIAEDKHSPGEARVNVAFANHNNFSADFNCEGGLPMNPKHKCNFN